MKKYKTWNMDEKPAPLSHEATWRHLLSLRYHDKKIPKTWDYLRKNIEDSPELDSMYNATWVTLSEWLEFG